MQGNVFYYSRGTDGAKLTRRPEGDSGPVARLEGLKVFKAGTFRDSRNRKHTWTAKDLETAVAKFSELGDVLPNVPYRQNHGRDVKELGGYFHSVSTDGQFLFANIDITEEDVAQRIENGTYRSHSLEIGAYRTNTEDVHFPVIQGLAAVDLPAVEGLHFSKAELLGEPTSTEDHEMTQEEIEWFAAASYAQALEDAAAQHTADQEWVAGATYAQALIDAAESSSDDDDKPPHEFSLGDGVQTANYEQVQQVIDGLLGFQAQAAQANRFSQIDQLVADNKVAAPTAEGLKEFTKGLDAEQFEAFMATYADAPTLAIFDRFGGGDPSTDRSEDDAKAVNEEIVSNFRRANMPQADIEKTDAWIALHGKKD